MRHLSLRAPQRLSSSVFDVKALFGFLRKNYLYLVFFLVLIGAGWPQQAQAQLSFQDGEIYSLRFDRPDWGNALFYLSYDNADLSAPSALNDKCLWIAHASGAGWQFESVLLAEQGVSARYLYGEPTQDFVFKLETVDKATSFGIDGSHLRILDPNGSQSNFYLYFAPNEKGNKWHVMQWYSHGTKSREESYTPPFEYPLIIDNPKSVSEPQGTSSFSLPYEDGYGTYQGFLDNGTKSGTTTNGVGYTYNTETEELEFTLPPEIYNKPSVYTIEGVFGTVNLTVERVYPLIKDATTTVPTGTNQIVMPYNSAYSGYNNFLNTTGNTAIELAGATYGATAYYDKANGTVVFNIPNTSDIYNTPGTYKLSGVFGELSVKVYSIYPQIVQHAIRIPTGLTTLEMDYDFNYPAYDAFVQNGNFAITLSAAPNGVTASYDVDKKKIIFNIAGSAINSTVGTYNLSGVFGDLAITVVNTDPATAEFPITKNTRTIEAGTGQIVVPYQAAASVATPGATYVTETSGITAVYDNTLLSVVFTIDPSSLAYTTPGNYVVSGEFGTLNLTVIPEQTYGETKFHEDFGTIPTTGWTTVNGKLADGTLCYNKYRGELAGRGQVGGAYSFQGYSTPLTSCEVRRTSGVDIVTDGQYALVNNPEAGFTWGSESWFGPDNTDGANGPWDHTGQVDAQGRHTGLMMLVNADTDPGIFYERKVDGLCSSSEVRFSFSVANVLRADADNIPVNVQYEIWSADPGFTATENLPADAVIDTYLNKEPRRNGAKLLAVDYTGDIYGHHSKTMVWRDYDLFYTMLEDNESVYVVLRNRGGGGHGNDLAIDDIKFEVRAPLSGKIWDATYGTVKIDDGTEEGLFEIQGELTGDFTENYYYRWQRSPKGLNAWVNMDIKSRQVKNEDAVIDIDELTNIGKIKIIDTYPFTIDLVNCDYRLLAAIGPDAFDNEACVVSFEFFSTDLPYALITSPAFVCDNTADEEGNYSSDFDLEVEFFGTIHNDEWEFTYQRENEKPITIQVPCTSEDPTGDEACRIYKIPQRITGDTKFKLISSGSGEQRVLVPQEFTVYLNPSPVAENNIRVIGHSPICAENDYTYTVEAIHTSFPESTIFNWIPDSTKYDIIGGQGTNKVTLRFKEGLTDGEEFKLNISAVADCDSLAREGLITIKIKADAPEFTVPAQFPTICTGTPNGASSVTSSEADFSLYLLSIDPVLGAKAYNWEWPVSNDIKYEPEKQIDGVTGRYNNQILISIRNGAVTAQGADLTFYVNAGNTCAYSAFKPIKLKLLNQATETLTLNHPSVTICSGETYDLASVYAVRSGVKDELYTYSYFSDEDLTQELKPAANGTLMVPAGEYWVKATPKATPEAANLCVTSAKFILESIPPKIDAKIDVNASCGEVTIELTPNDGGSAAEYYLFKDPTKDLTNPDDYVSFSSGSITFTGLYPGWYTYYVKRQMEMNGKTCLTSAKEALQIKFTIHPNTAVWTGSYVVKDKEGKDKNYADGLTWQNYFNWKVVDAGGNSLYGDGYPIWCTDVTIPEGLDTYPVLGLTSLQDSCRDITFEHGASVAQIHKLHYRRAFVQFRPDRNRWYTLAAPLKYMYSADYSFTDDESFDKVGTYGISPKVFMMYFDQVSPDKTHNLDGEKGTFSIGSFSKPFTRLEEPFSSKISDTENGQGQAFALWVNGDGNNLSYPTDAFPEKSHYTFPRLGGTKEEPKELVYHYHDARTGAHVRDAAITPGMRGENPLDSTQWYDGHKSTNYMDVSSYKNNRYRFAFEDMVSGNNVTLPLKGTTSPGGAKTLMLANPFMSYIDFDEIDTTNIQPYYRIWDGNTFFVKTTTNGPWKGLSSLGDKETQTNSSFIAPMQSVFVERKDTEASTVEFDMTAALVDPKAKDSEYHSLRSSQSNPKDALYLDLDMQGVKTRAIVAIRDNTSTNYIDGEDIFKLFSPNEVPEVYTLTDDQVATEINLVPQVEKQRIPVGIAMEGTGRGTLSVSGQESFVIDQIYFCDNKTGKRQDLHANPVVVIEKTSASEPLTQRYFLEINRVMSTFDTAEVASEDIFMIRESGSLTVYSNSSTLQSVEVLDISGKRILKKATAGTSCIIPTSSFIEGVYLIRAVSDVQTKTAKLIF